MYTIRDALKAGYTRLVTFWFDEHGGSAVTAPIPLNPDYLDLDLEEWSKAELPTRVAGALIGAGVSKSRGETPTDMLGVVMIWGVSQYVDDPFHPVEPPVEKG